MQRFANDYNKYTKKTHNHFDKPYNFGGQSMT